MDKLLRVGGGLESTKRVTGRRALLPAEAQLCNSVGLSEEEYWHFVELTEAYVPDEAELRADPVTIITLIVGLALSAISALMAPKPQQPKTPPNIKTDDIKGRSRFAPQSSFDSIQELSKLGAVIPLVFARKGVRVNSTLLWSQMLSQGIGQQLRTIGMFGSGQIEGRPDWSSYAIGDTLLENYTGAKIALYFAGNGGRLKEGGTQRYPEGSARNVPTGDAFSLNWAPAGGQYRPYFSGTRTPSTQAQFGVYEPIANGTRFRLNYEEAVYQDSMEDEAKDIITDKHNKVRDNFPRCIAVTQANADGAVLRIDGRKAATRDYGIHKTDDVNNAIDGERIASDEALAIGNEYLVGTGIAVVTAASPEPWHRGQSKDITFRWTEGQGSVTVANPASTYASYQHLLVQRVAVGTVSNNRSCDATEIGLKSTVYKQINGFANVNTMLSENELNEIEEDNGSFALGSMQTYISRLSFFTLEARTLGSNAAWRNISGGTVFCVRGRTPQPQYNYIRVYHPRGQYQFRMKPYAGNQVYRSFMNKDVWLLRPGSLISYAASPYSVEFAGQRLNLDPSVTSNPEWVEGSPPRSVGRVISVSSSSSGPPVRYDWGPKVKSGSMRRVSGRTWSWTAGGERGTITGGNGNAYPPRLDVTRGDKRITLGSRTGSATYSLYVSTLVPSTNVTYQGTVAASGGNGSGATFNVKVYGNGRKEWSLANGGSGYRSGNTLYIPTAGVSVSITSDAANILKKNFNPHDAISDGITYQEEKSSHQDSPEHEVVYVNEMLSQSAPQYENLCLAGLRIDSSKEWTTFSNLSAFFKTGTIVERLTQGGRSATNLLPEIAYALLTDPVVGAGTLIGKNQVNRDRMTEAALFCQANGFTWDGVIDEKLNLREWIFEQAGYCLLDFTILGGQFSLVPSVPVKSDWTIDHDAKPKIKALFTDGNIKDLKVSFLSPEERQSFIGVATYRQDTINGFPETRTVSMRLTNAQGGSDHDPVETFSMDPFCTTQEHAVKFLSYALKIRQVVDHGVTFQTTPQAAMNMEPGQYFRLASEVTHHSRFNNGSIGPDGSITAVDKLNGSYPILYWVPGTEGVREGVLKAKDNKCNDAALYGVVFTTNASTLTDRVYKVETLSYGEDGLIEIAGSHVPLTDKGSLAVLDWNGAFDVDVV